MKFLLCLLVLLPLVYCASVDNKRFVMDTVRQTLTAILSADATQAECEHQCGKYATGLLSLGCGTLCHEVIAALQKAATTPSSG